MPKNNNAVPPQIRKKRTVSLYYETPELVQMQKMLLDEAPAMGRNEVTHDEVGRALTHLWRLDPDLRKKVRNVLKGWDMEKAQEQAGKEAKGSGKSQKKVV